MEDESIPTSKVVLHYAPPPRRESRAIVLALLAFVGVVIELLGVCIFVGGVVGLVLRISDRISSRGAWDLLALGAIGIACFLFGRACYRFALRHNVGRKR